jgi:hypothetical protein
MQPLPLGTLAVRALAAQRQAYPTVFGAQAPASRSVLLPGLPHALASLHGLPRASAVAPPQILPRLALAASRVYPQLPPTVGPGNQWRLPPNLSSKTALRLSTALALGLPASLRRGPHLAQLLEEVLRHLDRTLSEHPLGSSAVLPIVQALAPAVVQCLGALVGQPSAALASPSFPQAQREALAASITSRFLLLLGNFDRSGPALADAGALLALAESALQALPQALHSQCTPALAAMHAKLESSTSQKGGGGLGLDQEKQ